VAATDAPPVVDDESLAIALEKKILAKAAPKTKAQLAILRQMEAYLKASKERVDKK